MKYENMKTLSRYLLYADDWLTGEELAKLLKTSTRTIRNYINELNQLNQNEEKNILSSAKGYRWKHHSSKQAVLNENQWRNNPQTPENRSLYWIRKLLIFNEVDEDEMINKLHISDATSSGDLAVVSSIVRLFNISLYRKKNKLFLSGSELDKRRLSIYCVMKYLGDNLLFSQQVIELFPEFDMNETQKIILTALRNNQVVMNGYATNNILLHLGVLLIRVIYNHTLTPQDLPKLNLTNFQTFNAATEVKENLENLLNIEISQTEIDYINYILICNTTFYTKEIAIFNGSIESNDYSQVIKEVLTEKLLQLSVTKVSDSLIKNVTAFFNRMIIKTLVKLDNVNPFTHLIRSDFPLYYNVSLDIMNMLSKTIHIEYTEDDTSELTLLLISSLNILNKEGNRIKCTVMAPEFYNSKEILLKKITHTFSEDLNIIETISVMDTPHIHPETQLVLSILPLPNTQNTILITPFLTNQDVIAIYKKIERIRHKNQADNIVEFFRKNRNECFFQRHNNLVNEIDILSLIAESLESLEKVECNFKKHLLDQAYYLTTPINNQVLILHDISDLIRTNTIFVIHSEQPMSWNQNKTNYVIFIALTKTNTHMFQDIYTTFFKFFSEREHTNQLKKATDWTSFIDVLLKNI